MGTFIYLFTFIIYVFINYLFITVFINLSERELFLFKDKLDRKSIQHIQSVTLSSKLRCNEKAYPTFS